MSENPLAYEDISKLLRGFAISSITATLVSSLYNIVDQIFIGQGVGYLGNAATNVSYPISTICLAISLLLGIGSAARFSLYLGKGEPDKAARLAGNGVLLMAGAGVLYLVIGEAFLTPLLRVFGATELLLGVVEGETRVLRGAERYKVILMRKFARSRSQSKMLSWS